MKSAFALLLLLPTLVWAQTITLTYENSNSYPWYMKDGSGIDLMLLKMVDKNLPEVDFKYTQAPWKRCLKNIETNVTEGCFSASFKEKRKAYGYYPGGEAPNKAHRIHSSSYSLYVLKGANISVSGKLSIDGLVGKVAAPAGYSIGDDLVKKGYKVDAGASLTTHNFEKLLQGRVKAVAALSLNGNNILSKNKKYSDKIQVLAPPLIDKPYYLMFSKKFTNSHRALVEKIWKTIGEVRETQAHKDNAGAFLSK
jgi:polar amino acid transport system substrate-binding protein